jgi:hypothetical protein
MPCQSCIRPTLASGLAAIKLIAADSHEAQDQRVARANIELLSDIHGSRTTMGSVVTWEPVPMATPQWNSSQPCTPRVRIERNPVAHRTQQE